MKGIFTIIFNKCERCWCFFSSNDSVCPNCKHKDYVDANSLKTFLDNNDIPKNVESLAYLSGVSLKNVNRILDTKEFSSIKKKFNNHLNIEL